jgi:hypothetical protein
MNFDSPSIDYDRVSVLAGAISIALALQRFLETPATPILSTTILGSPLGLALSASGLMLLIILGMSITAITSLIKGHPDQDHRETNHYMYWVMPGLLNVGLATWLNRIERPSVWVVGLLVSTILVASALIIEYWSVGRNHGRPFSIGLWQTALVHLTAMVLFTLIFDARIRSLVSATSTALVATFLGTRLLWMTTGDLTRAFRFGGTVGIILGQMTWGLNYWRLSGIQGGLILLLVFYLSVGLIQRMLQGHFVDRVSSQRVFIEFGSVAAAALLLTTLLAP